MVHTESSNYFSSLKTNTYSQILNEIFKCFFFHFDDEDNFCKHRLLFITKISSQLDHRFILHTATKFKLSPVGQDRVLKHLIAYNVRGEFESTAR